MVPYGAAAGIIALVMVWELYSLSLEAAGISGDSLLCILLYFRFAPRDVVIPLLMPAAYALNLHTRCRSSQVCRLDPVPVPILALFYKVRAAEEFRISRAAGGDCGRRYRTTCGLMTA